MAGEGADCSLLEDLPWDLEPKDWTDRKLSSPRLPPPPSLAAERREARKLPS